MAKDPFKIGDAPNTRTAKPPEPDSDGQFELIDTEHPAEKKILSLAKRIRAADKERSEANAKADKLRDELKELLHEHKIKRFIRRDVEINLRPSEERVSVRTRAQQTAGGDSDGDDETEE